MIAATSLRIVLHALHSLMPSILELASAIPGTSSPTVRRERQAQVRWRLEQIKFAIRMYLMFNYGKQIQIQQESTKKSGKSVPTLQPGIMLAGGIYQPMRDSMGISADELLAIQRKRAYRGRRTGIAISPDPISDRTSTGSMSPMPWILGEFLYSARPLVWSGAEARHAHSLQQSGLQLESNQLMKSWLITFAMDIVSLGLLSRESRSGNPLSREEWNRRRMKLLLYLLRAPLWTHATSPTLERISTIAQNVPLFGRIFDSYLWDWILYWKHPFVSEEG
jgi:Peroxisomal membrane protein (Pex16)